MDLLCSSGPCPTILILNLFLGFIVTDVLLPTLQWLWASYPGVPISNTYHWLDSAIPIPGKVLILGGTFRVFFWTGF